MPRKLKEFTPGRGYTKEDWDEVNEPHEPTDEELGVNAKPFAEVFPEMAAKIEETLKLTRGKQKAADQRDDQPARRPRRAHGLSRDRRGMAIADERGARGPRCASAAPPRSDVYSTFSSGYTPQRSVWCT